MTSDRSGEYVAGTIVAAVVVTLGAWLPWVRKLPVNYHIEGPVYTQEWVFGLDGGLEGVDLFLVGVVVVAVGAAIVSNRDWVADGVLVAAGCFVLVSAWLRFSAYRPVERYEIEPGLYLVLVGGLFLATIGAGALLGKVRTRSSLLWSIRA